MLPCKILVAMVELTAVLFNAEQLSVHCEPLAEFVAAEKQDVLLGEPGWGWRLVAVCRSQEEASEIAGNWQRYRNAPRVRQRARPATVRALPILNPRRARLHREILTALFPRPAQER
jgi:hypothetical protein